MAIKIRIVSEFDKKGVTGATKALDDLGKAAGVALLAVAAASAAIAVASVREFAKFDGALVKSQAIMGDLTKAMEDDMADAARAVAKATTFSAEQAAESFFFLASAGLDAKSSIAALPSVAAFAQAGMFDMARATDLLTDAQSALGLTIKNDAVANMENMVKISDVLVRANTLANASVEQFSTALTTKAGAALKALGKDVEEGVAVLAAFADQGIKGELAGTQLGIVLRDLTTKAITNKGAFTEMGIAVFDSTGDMNNLGDIIGDIEGALSGMSDETQKATLLQLGFSDKSLASLQALLGTSEAIKTYETELRSSMGYTEQVANKQLDTFNSQLKLLESAIIDVAIEIGEELTPYIQDLIPVLQNLLPVIGKKIADAIKKVDWAQLITDVSDFISLIVDNLDEIAAMATVLGVAAAALVIYTGVTKLATVATAAHTAMVKKNTAALLLNPWGLLAVAIAGVTYALIKNDGELEENTNNTNLLRSQTDRLEYTNKNLADSYKESAYAADKYGVETDAIKDSQLRLLAVSENVSGELGRFNRIKLGGLRSELAATSDASRALGNALADNNRLLYFAMHPELDPSLGINNQTPQSASGGGGGPSAFEVARDRVQDMVKSSQKELARAQKGYNDSVIGANKDYTDSVIRVQKQFADTLEGIIRQSQGRLTSAFQTATAVNVEELFLGSEDKSVEGLVKSLGEKLKASKNLLAKSADLASQGFSQTFIEQVVAAGTETGTELAGAILASTPETQANLRSLFKALETESSTGMDSLAAEIYEKQGLATAALEQLYATTQSDLAVALVQQQATLAEALEQAAVALHDSVSGIKSQLQEDIDDMDGMFGGLGATLDQFLAKLEEVKGFAIGKEIEAATGPGGSLQNSAVTVAASQATGAIGLLIDSASDVASVAKYLDARILGAEAFIRATSTTELQRASALETLAGFKTNRLVLSGQSAESLVGTTININVKADSSQSLAMVGKSLGNTVAKYVTGGGQVIVSPL